MSVRTECLKPASEFSPPSGEEIKFILKQAGLTGAEAAKVLGLKNKGGRTIRRWTSEESNIPYCAWAVLCHLAGLGTIWVDS